MPELPEVETIRRGLEPHLVGRKIKCLEVRQSRLRWLVAEDLPKRFKGAEISALKRRGKYLLFATDRGLLIVHLGMSGRLKLLRSFEPPDRHDHIDLVLTSGQILRYHDPRRFGFWLWSEDLNHPLLEKLGPEPFEIEGPLLHKRIRSRRQPIKNLLLDGRVLAGVGNIYANEALFRAAILPSRPALTLRPEECGRLVAELQEILREAIELGGTTLRDFQNSEGQPGSFQLALKVYGREGEACLRCQTPIVKAILAGRSTYFCPCCQR